MLSTNALPRLTAGTVTNGQIQLSLKCQTGIRCVIESSPDLASWTPVATNSDYTSSRLISLPASDGASFYRAARDPIPLFAYALAANGYLNFNGPGTLTDSWNSHDPNQSTNGHYNGYTGTNGDVASAEGYVDVGNKIINGDLFIGSSGSVILASGGNFTGQIYADSDIYFPDVSLPARDTNGNAITWKSAPVSSSHSFTNSGYYIISDSGTVSVEPGVVVTLDIKQATYNLSSVTIKGGTTNAATLIVYQESGSASLSGTVIGGAGNSRPENFIYFGLPGVTSIVFSSSSSTFVGAIYAPEAAATFSGGGGLNDFMGSCVFNTITVNGHTLFHFDESLLNFGPLY